jgi:MoaD family protein
MAGVRLRLFAAARQAAGRPVDEFDAGADRTLGEFLLAATQRYGPEFEAILRTSRVWVNGDEPEAGTATVVHDGDEVAVLPPVSGGS